MNQAFTGKNAVVTGGSRGIGAQVVKDLRANGCRVAVIARTTDHGLGDLNIACDVSDAVSQQEAFNQIAAEFGQLDYAFVNAGISHFAPILDVDLGEWDRVFNVNLRGALISLRHAAKLMTDKKSGSIITCCSIFGTMPDRYLSSYNASKAALETLTKTAARELGALGIRVNGIAPGFTRTDLVAGTEGIAGFHEALEKRTPLGNRIGEPEDISDATLKLFEMQWVTGQILIVDGGLTLHTSTDVLDFL